jgi:hypothetical protein
MLHVFTKLAARGKRPEDVASVLGARNPNRTIRRYPGKVASSTILQDLEKQDDGKRGRFHPRRWFYKDGEPIQFNGDTYIVSNQWGAHTEKWLRNIAATFRDHNITIEALQPGDLT